MEKICHVEEFQILIHDKSKISQHLSHRENSDFSTFVAFKAVLLQNCDLRCFVAKSVFLRLSGEKLTQKLCLRLLLLQTARRRKLQLEDGFNITLVWALWMNFG